MRLRWPFVEKVLRKAAERRNLDAAQLEALTEEMQHLFQAHFPANNEDTLAGSLSNTVPGRICNYFDFGAGGYTVSVCL
jgi:hypothetical protein